MNFEYSPEETEAQEWFVRFCRKNLTPAESAGQVKSNLAKLAEAGYLRLNLPESVGGKGMGMCESLPYHRCVARCCPSTFVSAEASAGTVAGLLSRVGNDTQLQLVPQLAQGVALAAFAVTEPGAGSDLFSMQTEAVRNGDGWLLTGRKCMILNAPEAAVMVVMAVTDRGAGEKGFSLFAVPGDVPGLSRGEPVATMGLSAAPLGDVAFDHCFLPADAVLGEPGAGLTLHAQTMVEGAIRYGALSLGISNACLDLALRRSKERCVGGKPIGGKQEVSFKLADMRTMIDASEQLTCYAAWLLDRGDRQAGVLASCAKLFASESASRIAHMAQQIFGGAGYLKGAAVERLCRDARFGEIGKGTSELHRVSIATSVLARFGREARPGTFSHPSPSGGE